MKSVFVRRHQRRRTPRMEVLMESPEYERKEDLGLTIRDVERFEARTGLRFKKGQAFVFLAPHMSGLRDVARTLVERLQETHLRNRLIETMVHEALHAAIIARGIDREIREYVEEEEAWNCDSETNIQEARRIEEEVVERISMEAIHGGYIE